MKKRLKCLSVCARKHSLSQLGSYKVQGATPPPLFEPTSEPAVIPSPWIYRG